MYGHALISLKSNLQVGDMSFSSLFIGISSVLLIQVFFIWMKPLRWFCGLWSPGMEARGRTVMAFGFHRAVGCSSESSPCLRSRHPVPITTSELSFLCSTSIQWILIEYLLQPGTVWGNRKWWLWQVPANKRLFSCHVPSCSHQWEEQ